MEAPLLTWGMGLGVGETEPPHPLKCQIMLRMLRKDMIMRPYVILSTSGMPTDWIYLLSAFLMR
jgi:hypothetical protein